MDRLSVHSRTVEALSWCPRAAFLASQAGYAANSDLETASSDGTAWTAHPQATAFSYIVLHNAITLTELGPDHDSKFIDS